MTNVTIDEVKTLSLRKDELLVFKLGDGSTAEDMRNFRKAVKKNLPQFSDRVLILCGDIEITKVRGF